MDEKIKAELDTLVKGLEGKTSLEVKNALDAFEAKVGQTIKTEAKSLFDAEIEAVKSELKADIKVVQKHADTIDVAMQGKNANAPRKSFNDVLKSTIEANAELFKNLKPNSGTTNIELVGAEGLEHKAMSIGANFGEATQLYQDARPLMITPYGNPFLGDILPQGSSTGTKLVVPKEEAATGGIDVWSGSGDKSEVNYNFGTQEVPFKWIAGWVIVDREMLDDVAWLTSYLQQRLLLDLKKRETAYILNEAVTGMIPLATAYDGDFTNGIERIIDGAYGQIVDSTDGGYSGTHLITRGRDAVKIGLNKASGSGEFDLPNGSMSFAAGNLGIAGLSSITTTSIAENNFLVFDAAATQFVRRLQPELRVFEDETLAKQNKIMFRIEERAALAVYNNSALVTGLITPPAV